MVMSLVTGRGGTVGLGRELGKGGEGAVYELPATSRAVAKLYHESLTPRKQEKIRLMARSVTRDLLSYTSWPVETLHRTANGPVVGFLMPRVTDRVPIHAIYGPSERRRLFPGAGWDFLVRVARNTAAAFAMIHSHGHVLGDVNQGNVLVGRDGRVVLIDSDSFQFRGRGGLFLCEVGVAHFTPPELQSVGGFATVQRTAQHDAFGLALLVFHLLFGGRHPYSGVPLIPHAGNALEDDIRALRFAYARDAKLRGTSPPPRSIPFGIVPELIQRMFHAAFTEVGVRGGRPNATDWVKALDDLGRHIHRCGTIHRYSNHLAHCPWCSAERQGVVFFPQPVVASPPVAYDLQRAWANIEAVVAPVLPRAPSINKAGLVPRPLPSSGVQGGGRRGLISSLMAGIREGTEKANERTRRQWALNNARSALDRIVADLPVTCGVQAFLAKKSELSRRRAEYLSLKADATKEVQKLLDAAAEDQKRRFLESFPVSAARVQGVGATKKQAMQSAGIRTAADVSMASLLQLKGFGTTSAVAMTRWRAACEQRFRFDPQPSQAEIAAVQVRYAKRRQTLEKALDDGAAVLGSLVVSARTNTKAMMGKLEQASTDIAQAEVDLTLC
jgi:DNA-binding helix-hairpin-helix protein with protein kinase domain